LSAMDEEKKIEVERLFLKAGHDIQAARAILKETPPITDVACFLAQQCAEKSLKAYLCFVGAHIENTHDLAHLVGACEKFDNSFGELAREVRGMTAYAVKERYPTNWREIPSAEAVSAVGRAEKVMALAKVKIKW